MKKNIFLIFPFAFFTVSAIAQAQLNISPGTTFFISNGATVFVDGLSLKPSANFSISAPNSVVRNTTLVNAVTGTYISRVYKWSNPVNIFNGDITIHYEDAELNSIPESGLVLEAHDGTRWMAFEPGATRDATANFVTAPVSNINFNELTLAWREHALPLIWGAVRAYRKNGLAYVEWNTQQETNTAYFEIWKSTDGATWQFTGKTIAAHNSPGLHRYVVQDNTVTGDRTYYRITQVDRDNRHNYSEIVMIEAINDLRLTLYPNPAKDFATIQSSAKFTAVALLSVDGKLLRVVKTGPVNSHTIKVSDLRPGYYVIRMHLQDGNTLQQKFIKN